MSAAHGSDKNQSLPPVFALLATSLVTFMVGLLVMVYGSDTVCHMLAADNHTVLETAQPCEDTHVRMVEP